MTQEEFFAAENERNEKSAKAYRANLKQQSSLVERQVIAQEAMVQYLGEIMKESVKSNDTNKEEQSNGK